MARTRNIKPSFFSNDDLAECCAHTRLLFIGLWTLADKAGRLEDKPKRINAALFPYEEINCHELLVKLHGKKFITRYAVNGEPFIQINNFAKHQNPHPKEQASTIPEPAEICEAVELHDEPCKEHDMSRSSFLQSIPSLSNPSSNPSISAAAPKRERGKKLEHPEFENFYSRYPHKIGRRAASDKFYEAIQIASLGELLNGLSRYIKTKPPDRNWCNPATWLHQERWKDEPNETSKQNYRKSKSEQLDDITAEYLAQRGITQAGGGGTDRPDNPPMLRSIQHLREEPGSAEEHAASVRGGLIAIPG